MIEKKHGSEDPFPSFRAIVDKELGAKERYEKSKGDTFEA